MTEINIITTDIESAEQIIVSLESENLAINGFIEKESSLRLSSKWKITAQTRAVLFDVILARVYEISKKSVLTVYSKPIVNMQWEQADALLKTLKTV